jgi:hypothetical protein
LVGVALNALWFYRQTSWHVTATVDGLVQMLVVTVLLTIVLEQRRKRAIRRTLELAFLNHHVRNALTQMSMVSYIADPEKQERLLQDAASRVSEVLFRIANSADLTGLSLEVDLAGVELAHAGEGRGEEGELAPIPSWVPRAAAIVPPASVHHSALTSGKNKTVCAEVRGLSLFHPAGGGSETRP